MNADNHDKQEERGPLIVQQIKGTNSRSSVKSKSNRSATTTTINKHYNIVGSNKTASGPNKSRQPTTTQLKTTQISEVNVSYSGYYNPTISSSSSSSSPPSSSSPSSKTTTTTTEAAEVVASQQEQHQDRYHSFDKSNSYRGQELVVDERKACKLTRIDIEEGEEKPSRSSAKKGDEYLNATASAAAAITASANQLKRQHYSTTATNIPIVEQKQRQQLQQHHQVENKETDVTDIKKSFNEAGGSYSAYEKRSQVTDTNKNQYTNDRSANNERVDCIAIKPLAYQEIQEYQSQQQQQHQHQNQQALVFVRKNQEAQIQIQSHHQAYCFDKKQQKQHQDKQQTASTENVLNNSKQLQDYQEASIDIATTTTTTTTEAETEVEVETETSGSSLLFWKFLSNLPKSITQRGRSPPGLAPEVAGYLANKLQLKQKCDNNNNNSNSNNNNISNNSISNNSNISMPPSTPKTTPTSSSTAATATTTTTTTNTTPGAEKNLQSSQVDNRRLSDDCQDQQQQQQQEMIMMNHYSASDAHRGLSTTSRIIRIVAPQTEPSTAQIIQTTTATATNNYPSESANKHHHRHHQHHNQDISKSGQINRLPNEQSNNDLHLQTTTTTTLSNQQRTKLSIASSRTTTRSSATSLSSCILSDSASSSEQVRLKWGKKMDFLLSIIGFAVDLANIWRFPYLVYKNGGGVFLIPYLIMLIFGGIPLFFLELCLGQFVKKGPITVWNKICPSMKGVGYCSIMISWYVSFYYNVLIAWSVYFIYRSLSSFGEKMPWEDCDNSWNSKGTCVSISQLKELCSHKNVSLEACRKDLFDNVNVTSPASEFFVKELSQIDRSTGLDDMGYLRWELVFCTMIVYLLHYFSLFRGLETSGKVVWVTATAPYMILSILLVRGLYLPGATMGIKYYLSPRLEKLADPQVWIDAAGQVFYSIGVGFGVHLTYASFNSHNNNCYRDCLMTSAVNALTSVYSGLVVFVYLGYMAKNLGIEIDKVASEGYSLVFEVYPEALTTLPFARFWSILFFIMLLTLGIDSAMGGLEAVITGLEDEFRFARRLSRGQLTGLVIVSSFLPALISCTQGGAYTLFWFDIYSAGVSLLFSALFETIGVVYCYGLNKFIPNIESMLGRKPPLFYILCWKYISPIFLCGVIFMSIYTAGVPTYRGYTFPLWSIILGWCFAFSSVIAIPIFAILYWARRWLTSPAALTLGKSSGRKRDRGSAIVAV